MITLGFCPQGKNFTKLEPLQFETFADLSKAFSKCTVGEKDGAYFTRSFGTTRRNEALSSLSRILLVDADSHHDNGVIAQGAPSPAELHTILKSHGINHHIYTSYSNGINGLIKYRCLLPCKYDRTQLISTLDYFFSLLILANFPLVNVAENTKWSQPWYLPRSYDKSKFMFYKYLDGIDLKAVNGGILPNTKLDGTSKTGMVKIRDSKMRLNAVEQYGTVKECLLFFNYKAVGNRMIRPDSSTGTAGVSFMTDKETGIELAFSHGGDALSGKGWADTFDVVQHLMFNGSYEETTNYFQSK